MRALYRVHDSHAQISFEDRAGHVCKSVNLSQECGCASLMCVRGACCGGFLPSNPRLGTTESKGGQSWGGIISHYGRSIP